MRIKVNGEYKTLDTHNEELTLSRTLELLSYSPNTIVVELNKSIVNYECWDKKVIKEGDNIEIVSIVGGG